MRPKVDIVNHLPDEDVLELVHSVMHRYRALQYRVLRDGPHDITHMDAKVVGFFSRHPGATQSDLAAQSGRDKAQLARLIAGLRGRGLLESSADATDRRSQRLSLTSDGQAVQKTLKAQARRLGRRAVAGFTADERERLVALLGRVRINLEDDD